MMVTLSVGHYCSQDECLQKELGIMLREVGSEFSDVAEGRSECPRDE